MLLTLPSNRHDGRTFRMELRRGGFDYDAGIGTRDGDGNAHDPPAGLVVHSLNSDGSLRYDGVADLKLAEEMTDWASPSGDFALRLLYVDPGHEFVDVAVRGGGVKSFPIRGVLLAGGFRTPQQLNAMTHDDMRNTLIVEIDAQTGLGQKLQAFSNMELALIALGIEPAVR